MILRGDMPTHFVFVDETGDLGPEGTDIYGYGILVEEVKDYSQIRQILVEERWRFRLFRDFEVDTRGRQASNVFTQLQMLAEVGKISASGFYINKKRYGGRYLHWSEIKRAKRSLMPHRLRNYLLRKALEFHYSDRPIYKDQSIDLVLDRIAVNADQRRNLEDYIMGHKSIQRREPFRLPKIDYVTISDSSYTEALQIAHMVADLVKKCAAGTLQPQELEFCGFIKFMEFWGHKEPTSLEGGATQWSDPPSC